MSFFSQKVEVRSEGSACGAGGPCAPRADVQLRNQLKSWVKTGDGYFFQRE